MCWYIILHYLIVILTHIWIYIHVSSSKNVVVLHGEICKKAWDLLPPEVHLGWMFFEDNPLLGTLGFFAQAGFVFFPQAKSLHVLQIAEKSYTGHRQCQPCWHRWWHLNRLIRLITWWLEVISTTGSPQSCSQPTTGASLMVSFSCKGYFFDHPGGLMNVP